MAKQAHSVVTVLQVVPSMSNPAKSYEIRRGHDHNVYCTCPAWKFQRVAPANRTCKHLKAFFAAQASLPTEAPAVLAREEAVELLITSGDKQEAARAAQAEFVAANPKLMAKLNAIVAGEPEQLSLFGSSK